MLGENHSLINEFPQYQDIITSLTNSDLTFAKESKRYNALDKNIRVLELNNGPIDDAAMQQLKHERAELKDYLYRCLVAAEE